MDLFKIFRDEGIIELLESGTLTIGHNVMEEGDTRIYFTPTDQKELTKILLETLLDVFVDYDIILLIEDDETFFVIRDYPKK